MSGCNPIFEANTGIEYAPQVRSIENIDPMIADGERLCMTKRTADEIKCRLQALNLYGDLCQHRIDSVKEFYLRDIRKIQARKTPQCSSPLEYAAVSFFGGVILGGIAGAAMVIMAGGL